MIRYVIDASVVLVALLESRKDLVDNAKKIFLSAKNGRVELVSSSFLKMEVANGLRFNEKDSEKATKIYRGFLDLPIKFISLSKNLYQKSLFNAYKLGTTVYDTSYHILAKARNATFLTCDEDYYQKAKGLGDIKLLI